ncbi:MAG: HAD family phosphatase [Bacteroidetes bacterium]|nr:MAG: HAD family phosphatase [Bacteroidota bacterium]
MTMNKSTLFVTDLDGTLLRSEGRLSAYSREWLLKLLEAEVPITVATARSIVSTREAIGDIPFRLPLICGNGAYIIDPGTDRHLQLHAIDKVLASELWHFVCQEGFYPILNSTYRDEERLYIGEIKNEAMKWYLSAREVEGDPRLAYAQDWEGVMAGELICLNIMERKQPLQALEAAIQARYPGQLVTYTYENWFHPEWYWLSVYDRRATKAGGVQVVMADLGVGPEQVVVFGDGLNDLSMFAMGARGVAPANAASEVLALAQEVIGTNDTDSVIKYIAKTTGHTGDE